MGFSRLNSILGIFFGCIVINEAALEFAQQLRDCHSATQTRNDLNVCLARVLNELKPRLAKGIPELDVPPLEPIFLGAFDFNQTSSGVRVFADFKNVFVHGFSNFSLVSVDSDIESKSLTIQVYIPKLHVVGGYTIDGKIHALELKGRGPMRAILININAVMTSQIVRKPTRTGERLGITNTKIDFQLGKTKARLANLFDGNTILAQTVDHFIAHNEDLILREIRPGVSKDIAAFVEIVMDRAFANIPVDVVYY